MAATVDQGISEKYLIPDRLWERMKGLFPVRERQYRNPGRKPLEWRKVLNGIFYVLRTGCQWKATPREFGSGSSLHRYFQQLVKLGIFEQLWKLALEEYDELKGIQWEWQSIDGATSKAPLGGEKNRAQSHGSRQVGDQAVAADGRRRGPVGGGRGRGQHARQAVG
jgi:transposase